MHEAGTDTGGVVRRVLNHIGLSGGKDSTAMWGWAIMESGYPKESILGTFCDTENEYQEVYDQIATLSKFGQKHGVAPVVTLKSEGFLKLCLRKKRFPSAKARFCTQFLKIVPFIAWCQDRIAEGFDVIAHSGVRRDESTERSMLDEWGVKHYAEGVSVKVRRPLLDWPIEKVWEAHKRWGLPINPLYFQGRKRVGCKLCCMSSKEDVRLTALHHPETIELYREWEAKMAGVAKRGMGTFFPRRTVPEHFRSVKGFIRTRDARDGKKGEEYAVCTIDDVVKWSQTLRGGKQQGFKFMFEEDDSHLPCQSGYCE